MHFGFTNMGSEVFNFRVIAIWNRKFWFGSPCNFRPATENDIDLVIFQNDSSGYVGCISQVGHQGGSQIIQLTEDECFTRNKIALQIFDSIGISLVSDVFTYCLDLGQSSLFIGWIFFVGRFHNTWCGKGQKDIWLRNFKWVSSTIKKFDIQIPTFLNNSGNICCDSICTFDHECDFHEICKYRKCVEDTTIEWHCSSGRYKSPSMACKKVKKSTLEGMPL